MCLVSSEKRRIWREKSFARFERGGKWVSQANQSNEGLEHRLWLCREADQHHLRRKNILLHDICAWPVELSINPCNKSLPHVSQIRTVARVHNWSQSQGSTALTWSVVTPNISFQNEITCRFTVESLQYSSKVPKAMQMVHGRSEELCIVLNHGIISVCVVGRGIGGEANRKRGKLSWQSMCQ